MPTPVNRLSHPSTTTPCPGHKLAVRGPACPPTAAVDPLNSKASTTGTCPCASIPVSCQVRMLTAARLPRRPDQNAQAHSSMDPRRIPPQQEANPAPICRSAITPFRADASSATRRLDSEDTGRTTQDQQSNNLPAHARLLRRQPLPMQHASLSSLSCSRALRLYNDRRTASGVVAQSSMMLRSGTRANGHILEVSARVHAHRP